ncbi:MAG: tetratricopeptide repeat protein [Myxococcales bacterium]|nr:tetratricopeptide repeat protein [Myxococcales bacterium]
MLSASSTRLAARGSRSRRRELGSWLVGVELALLLLAACGPDAPEPSATAVGGPRGLDPAPEYVTTAVCASCHPEVFARWAGSLHDRAMEPASELSILGDLASAPFEQRGDEFFVRAESAGEVPEAAGATPREHPLRYTFGAYPLQQYLAEQPGGRLQVLPFAWDARPADAGGQRWFSLEGDEAAAPGDVMHWTGFAHNWNTQCADCHSTGVRRGFDRESGTYATSWSDLDVGCEACHGPGSRHLAWAEAADREAREDRGLAVVLADAGAGWHFLEGDPIARRGTSPGSQAELEVCAACHSRRSRLREADPGTPFLDAYRPELLEPGLYHADGQILDEVYVWGSFLQSRMYRAGVRCSDCHDPHSLELRGGPEQVCAQCHASEHFASPSHHHHSPGHSGSSCVDCHMSARTYMQIDPRRDHGFRIPRPDLGERAGVPDACTGCHDDRSSGWAADVIAAWTGERPGPHFAETLQAARRGEPGVAPALAQLARDAEAAGIVRATALTELARVPAPPGLLGQAVAELRGAADPLLRYSAARAAEALPLPERLARVGSLARDPVVLVRAEAGRVLAAVPTDALAPDERASLDAAIETYREAQLANAERPSAQVNLGLLELRRGDLRRAEARYREAIRLGPHFIPAYVNLADLFRQTGRDLDARALLEEARRIGPEVAEVHYALGLLLVRQKELEAALGPLARAAELAPGHPRLAYVYALALHSAGRTDAALEALARGLEHAPYAAELLQALVELSRAAGRTEAADALARRLQELESRAGSR